MLEPANTNASNRVNLTHPAIVVRNHRRTPILFLDLDGTVRKGYDELEPKRFVNQASDVELFPHMAERLLSWRQRGYRVVGVTNQGGVALGHLDYPAMADALVRTQQLSNYSFDLILACTHHPDAHDPEMAQCFCRKPRMGMLVMAQTTLSERHPEELYPPHLMLMVGDRNEDHLCAAAAGIKFQWAADWRAEPFTINVDEKDPL